MLRTSLRSARLLCGQPIAASAGRQWPLSASRRAVIVQNRYYADHKDPKPPVLPTSETKTSERDSPPPPESPIERKVGLDEVPMTPPEPPKVSPTTEQLASTATVAANAVNSATSGSAPPPPPKKKGFTRRLRSFVMTLVLLGALGFGSGVWYSRINDNFHDFFTEYVPFGERVLLYIEELEFRKKFPHARSAPRSADEGERVRIPAHSGASWRVADTGEPVGRHSSSTSATKTQPAKNKEESKKAEESAKKETPATSAVEAAPVADETKTKPSSEFKSPEVNEASRFPPLEPIDLMGLADAKEPIVQDLVRMLNDLIVVINADGAHGKYSTTISKAKREVTSVGEKLQALKTSVEKKAAGEVKSTIAEFDTAATELIKRVENTMVQQETSWRQEFEDEMKKVRDSYEQRAKLLLEREQQLNEEKVNTKLMEQAIALKKEFVKELKDRVEAEREGRLSKLKDLSSAVSDLEKLTVGWNSVVDTNLKTQQMHVAVEAVRASLEGATHPKPFIKELVALKEISSDGDVVDAAIGSINPTAYQRGISSPSYLIDRFRRVAGEVRKASLLPEDAGVASHASSWVLSHIMFKKQGLAEGTDVESILTRTQTYLEEGDLDAAAREMNGLQGWAKTLSRDWLGEVRKVLEVQQALDVIATEARLQSLRVD